MSAPELIEHVVQNKPLKFQEKIREILESKVIAALEHKKIDISSSITEEPMYEEDEDCDDNLNFDFELDDEDFDLDEDDLNEAISDDAKLLYNHYDRNDNDTGLRHRYTERQIKSALKKDADDHVKKHLNGAYLDGGDIVHSNSSKTMGSINKDTTMGQLRQQVHGHIHKHFASKNLDKIIHPEPTRSIVSASDEEAQDIKKNFHNKNTQVRIMKRKDGNKVYLDSVSPDHHKTVIDKLKSTY